MNKDVKNNDIMRQLREMQEGGAAEPTQAQFGRSVSPTDYVSVRDMVAENIKREYLQTARNKKYPPRDTARVQFNDPTKAVKNYEKNKAKRK